MISRPNNIIKWILIILSCLIYSHLGYFVPRSSFPVLLFDVTLLFIIFYFYYKYFNFDWAPIFIFRVILIASTPSLSDDYYRFIWDGNLLKSGINPYQYLPSELPADEIFRRLNSKNYFTVYPPFLQTIFGLAAWLANGNILWNIILLRLPIIAADLGSTYLIMKLLTKFNLNPKKVLLFAINPFIIIELTGNLHFESLSIFFTLLAFYYLSLHHSTTKNLIISSTALALAAQIKLLPFIFIPLIINNLGLKKGIIYSLTLGVVFSALFIPFFNQTIVQNISNSLDLYFQKFEFNASIYYLVKWAGIFLAKNNPIQTAGPILSIISLVIILWLSLSKKIVKSTFLGFIQIVFFINCSYVFLATTVHPWYLAPIIVWGIFTQFSFQIGWSFLIFLSYSAYSSAIYHENLWLVALEYFLVFLIFIYEIIKLDKKRPARC
jgi:alpha-1,6-mannosyltransferase